MDKIEFKIFPIAPSQGLNPQIVTDHFNWRKTSKYNGISTVQAGEVLEPIWWNRPLTSEVICKQEADGLYSYNLPFIYRKANFKTDYNILVNKHSIPLIIQIKINHSWTNRQKQVLSNLALVAAYQALLALGVDKTKLVYTHNDLLYNGKKFMGSEEAEYGGWYGSASIITLNYSEEQEIFKRLTGKYALARGICGIQEETNNLFTKEEFIQMLFQKIQDILKSLT